MSDSWASDGWARLETEAPKLSEAEEADLLLGTVTGILAENGDEHAVAVLLDSELVVEEHGWDWDAYHFTAILYAPRHALPILTEERQNAISAALDDARAREQHQVRELIVRPNFQRAAPGWRESLSR